MAVFRLYLLTGKFLVTQLSYINTNILVLRLLLVMASIFLILHAIFFGYIWLDSIIYNSIMICCNIVYSIPLLKQYIDVELNPVEEEIYQKIFSRHLDRRTAKVVLDSGNIEYRSGNNYLTQTGNNYVGVYLVAKLDPKKQLAFFEEDKEIYRENNAYTWMGIIEYTLMQKAKQDKTGQFNWPISIKLEDKKEVEDQERVLTVQEQAPADTQEKINNILPQDLHYYLFEFNSLQSLYEGENGTFIKNALHSVWLDAICHKITLIDEKVAQILGKEKVVLPDYDFKQQMIEKFVKHEEPLVTEVRNLLDNNNNEVNEAQSINNHISISEIEYQKEMML